MSKDQIKQYYERIEKLLNGASKETYEFAPEEIRQMLKWYEYLQTNWNELKKWLEDEIIECKVVINTILPEFENIMPRSSGKTLLTSEYYRQQTIIKSFEIMLSKMQELEKGKSE